MKPPPAVPFRAAIALLALVGGLAACSPAVPTGSPTASTDARPVPAASPASHIAAGGAPRPIVVTTDMGMDDLLAIYLLLRDPSVDIRAITVDGTGLVHCGPGLRSMRRILVAFGRPEIPFACGRDDPGDDGIPFPDDWRAGSDDMYGIVLPPVAGTEFPPDGATLLADTIRASDEPVTIVALGPWTTLQDMFAADGSLATRVAGIHAMAGAIDVPGNMDLATTITPADGVEWNVGADPDSFADVLALDIPVTLVPLDATNDVPVPADIAAQLETDHAAAGADIAYETYIRNPWLADSGNYWWDGTAAAGFSDPSLLTWEDAPVSINARGRISRDAGGRPVRFATGADTARTQAAILAGLRRGAPRPEPFAATGTLSITWDGTTCQVDGDPPASAGLVKLVFHNRSAVPAGLLGASVRDPHTWPEVVSWVMAADFSDPTLQPPDWIVPIEGPGAFADPGGDATSLADLPSGTMGLVCGTGEWPDLALVDGGSFTVGE